MRTENFKKKRTVEEIEKQTTAANVKPKSILESFEYIVELAEESALDSDFFSKAAPHINMLCASSN